jgi:predicted nucleic acid-binding protein
MGIMKLKYVLDSTIAIDLFNGLEEVKSIRESLRDAKVYASVITRLEMLSWPKINSGTEMGIREFLKSIKIIPLTKKIEKATLLLRQSKKLKLPDAIIAGTALVLGATLISRDRHFLELSWPGLPVIPSV